VDVADCSDSHEPPVILVMHRPRTHMTRHGSAAIKIGAIPAAKSQLQFRTIPPTKTSAAIISRPRRPLNQDQVNVGEFDGEDAGIFGVLIGLVPVLWRLVRRSDCAES
jgi:hypothetical protein